MRGGRAREHERRDRDRQQMPHSRAACELREMAEDRCDVAVAEEHHREHDPRHREPGAPGDATRLQHLAEREDRRHEQRPADRVVEEGRAREEPRVLLVDQERGGADEQRERERQRPPAARQLPAHERELDGAGEHRHLGPRGVREHVERRVREEDRDRPEQDAEPEGDRRPQVQAPAAHREDLGADDRLRQQDQPEQEKPRRERPVDELSSRSHGWSGGRR